MPGIMNGGIRMCAHCWVKFLVSIGIYQLSTCNLLPLPVPLSP
jgi:hypothetical protein